MKVTMRCQHCKNPLIIAEATHIRYAISVMKQYKDSGRIDVCCHTCGTPRTIVPARVVLTQPEKVSIVDE